MIIPLFFLFLSVCLHVMRCDTLGKGYQKLGERKKNEVMKLGVGGGGGEWGNCGFGLFYKEVKSYCSVLQRRAT